ncbi:MAG TPA: pseudaminic acid cytidylyltransferase [Opitutaceae bacterium]|nr:pseudaminic acid cytidylyltransferase [Opitutaceae bacterium]
MKVAIITARGGSKRIPRKNIREFCGRPIIAYSVAAALQSGLFDEVMVSTDDLEIAEVARAHGAEVPFLRSPETSNDHATTADVLLEVLERYTQNSRHIAIGCCIYPTAPLLQPRRLAEALAVLEADSARSTAFPVTRFSYPIQRALRLKGAEVSLFQPEYRSIRSQDLEPAYHDAGQFYWFRAEPFRVSRTLMGPGAAAIILPEEEVQDIDNEEDWTMAEIKYRLLNEPSREVKEDNA